MKNSLRKSLWLAISICGLCIALFMRCSMKTSEDGELFYDFESADEFENFRLECGEQMALSDSFITHGKAGLKLDLFPTRFLHQFTGLKTGRFDKDWSAKSSLHIDFFNPQRDTLKLYIKIADARDAEYSDRYERSIRLHPGTTHFNLPFDSLLTNDRKRKLKLKSIWTLEFFLANVQERTTLFCDYLHLE